MWFESVYGSDAYDSYEKAFEIADFERRYRREHQFDAYDVCDHYCDNEKSSSSIFQKLAPKINVSLLVFQNGIVKLNIFFNKN